MTLTAAEAASGRRSEAGCYPRFLATGREPRWRAEHPKEDLACSQWLHPAHNHTRTIHTGAPPARVCKGTLPRCPLPPSAPLSGRASLSLAFHCGPHCGAKVIEHPGASQLSSVAHLCLTLCDPMNHRAPGLPVHHQLLKFTQTHAHRVGDAIQPSHPLSSLSPPAFNLSQHQGLFK